jgi:hypothetical protein
MFENLTRAEYEVLLRHDLATFADAAFKISTRRPPWR